MPPEMLRPMPSGSKLPVRCDACGGQTYRLVAAGPDNEVIALSAPRNGRLRARAVNQDPVRIQHLAVCPDPGSVDEVVVTVVGIPDDEVILSVRSNRRVMRGQGLVAYWNCSGIEHHSLRADRAA